MAASARRGEEGEPRTKEGLRAVCPRRIGHGADTCFLTGEEPAMPRFPANCDEKKGVRCGQRKRSMERDAELDCLLDGALDEFLVCELRLIVG